MKTKTGDIGRMYLAAAATGLIATAVTGVADRLLDRLVSKEQKRRDRMVREGTAHEVAGPLFAERITKHELSEKGKKRAKAAFSLTYALVWGTVYTLLRRKYPAVGKFAGFPFAIPFFIACDGLLAPLLKVSPRLTKVPWQPTAKEAANHVAWAATAEMVQRVAR